MKRVFTTVEHFEGGVHMHTIHHTKHPRQPQTPPLAAHIHKGGHCAENKHTLIKHIKYTPCMAQWYVVCAPAGVSTFDMKVARGLLSVYKP